MGIKKNGYDIDCFRELAEGTAGAGETIINLIEAKNDEYWLASGCCIENLDAAKTFYARIGIYKNGKFYPHIGKGAVAAKTTMQHTQDIHVHEHETLQIRLTPSAADAAYLTHAHGWLISGICPCKIARVVIGA